MAAPKPGERIKNPLTGETVTFLKTSDQPGGEVEMELELRPLGMPGGGPHRHLPGERFSVLDGRVLFVVAGQRPKLATRGDVVEIEPCRWHAVIGLSRRASAHTRLSPGMRFDELVACAALVAQGKVGPENRRRLAELMREHDVVPRLP